MPEQTRDDEPRPEPGAAATSPTGGQATSPGGDQGVGSPPEDGQDAATSPDGDQDGAAAPAFEDVIASGDDDLPLEEIVVERPVEAIEPLGPLALAGTGVAGFLMGTADVVPGFSGGTVALVVGIYERLIANIRQGARALSLLLRGRVPAALRALLVIEWPFIAILLTGILAAIFTLAAPLRLLIEEQPALLKATFLGLVLGASVVASKELRAPNAWHVLIGVVVAFGVFFGLGLTGGITLEPSVLTFFVGGAIAVTAMILPGISGSFILLLLGLWTAVVGAAADRQLDLLLVFGLGCVAGLAAFSTLLNWLLARFHDLVLAALIGLMVGSARVLWPYPAEPFENVELGLPDGTEGLLALALALTAFSVVWMLGLLATGIQRRRARRVVIHSDDMGVDDPSLDDPNG